MKILIACEMSGITREAFAAKGHDSWSCDLLPTEIPSKKHIQGDVREILNNDWDCVIAHPVCTYLCNSGVRWLKDNEERWGKLKEAAEFFKLFLDLDVPKICIENPIMHKHALALIGGVKQTQVIQPYQFGHPEKKATALWLKGLPPLVPTNNVYDEMLALPKKLSQRIFYASPSPDRSKLRSMTYPNIAAAFANQWG